MKLDLAGMVARKRTIVFRPIEATAAQAADLFAIYRRVVEPWALAVEVIVASYAKTLADLVTDAPADTNEAIDGVAADMRRLILRLTPELRDWALRVEKVHRGKWVRNILSAASIDLETILTLADVQTSVDAAIQWNVGLIRDVGDETRRRIANAVFSGFQQRKPASEVAKEIREAVDMSRARARRIASDQTVKLGAQLNQARQQQAGLDHFKWRHSGKVHPREWHRARDGKTFRWDDPLLVNDLPGAQPFCGCTAQGVIVFDD